ncbi:MAG: hypothetical protein ACFFBP_02450 [Promethearchaeota archaeon]
MDEKKFYRIVNDLKEYKGIEEVYLLNNEGEIIFKEGMLDFSPEEAKKLLIDWKNKNNSIFYIGHRFAIIKNDELQLAAKNISDDMGNIAGSITNEGDYLIAHIAKETDIILLEWSILINKLAWS